MAVVEFKILSRDDDGMLELQVTITGNGHAMTHIAYIYPEHLKDFGAELQLFPFDETKEVVLEAGSQDSSWYGFMQLRVFLLSSFGRSALEIQYDTRGELPRVANGTFYVTGEPASFNRLGEDIENFVAKGTDAMRTEWREV
jgi:hypothetical protein